MIDCETVQENLSAYMDDELSAEDGRKIYHHLQTCQVCNREYMELKITSAIMCSLDEVEPPPEVKERVMERLFNEVANKPASKFKFAKWHTFGAVAAGLLLLVGSWGLFFDGGLTKILGDPAGTQEIALEAPKPQEGEAFQEEIALQPFSAAVPESTGEADDAALMAAPEDHPPVDAAEPSGELNVGQREYWEDPPVKSKEVDGDEFRNSRRYAGQQSSPEVKWDEGNLPEPEMEQAPEFSIAAIESEQESADGLDETIDDSLSKVTLMNALPSEEGLQMELRIRTQDLSQTHKAIERIGQVYELEVLTQETDEVLSIEIYVPISLQGTVKEELEALGHVTGEEITNPDLYQQICTLIGDRKELEQQQIELRAMISNGGSPENLKVWQGELTTVTEKVDEIAARIHRLEEEYGPTCIKLIVAK